MLKIGDEVKVLYNVNKGEKYACILGETGVIKDIKQYGNNKPLFYVDIPNNPNDSQRYGFWIFYEENLSLMENEKMSVMQQKGILDLYRDKKREKIYSKYDKQLEQIKMKDDEYRYLKEMEQQIKKLSPNLQECLNVDYEPFRFSRDFADETSVILDKREAENKQLHRLCYEISTMLSECTTYEQRQNVYKTYNIIDEKGKLKA